MRFFWTLACLIPVAGLSVLRADPGDVESSHDYPGFSRLPGFVISDYDEDNPAVADIPVARPQPDDADHVETVHVKGHRYIIRYELSPGVAARSLLQTQQFYEKLATDGGFKVEKTGAVGDVTETYHAKKGARDFWVHLEPGMAVNILTIVEAEAPASPPAPPEVKKPVPEDPLYDALIRDGRVVLPLAFLPGKPDIDADAQPTIDRVVTILLHHPEIVVNVEGHTDDTGDPGDNQRLSAQRARAVRALIVAGGIAKSRIAAVGYGGDHPVDDNGTPEGRAKNRRIELALRKEAPDFHKTAPNGTNYYPATH
jgi:outer membrane protein OmpA-like peptidoglycan-associated protein